VGAGVGVSVGVMRGGVGVVEGVYVCGHVVGVGVCVFVWVWV
jgi:hypothetical protein